MFPIKIKIKDKNSVRYFGVIRRNKKRIVCLFVTSTELNFFQNWAINSYPIFMGDIKDEHTK